MTSSAYGNNISDLHTSGLIEYPQKGFVVASKVMME